ncbi:MAG TPA: gamma-glutamyltransferase [Beutenbergiaceae bacterium]|nr:gamma-glutamyltransferase [Beutenbergiaceae bacterium]
MSRQVTLAVCACAAVALTACGTTEPEPPAPSTTPPPATQPSPEPAPTPTPTTEEPESVLEEYGISAGHPLAVDAGEEVLADGGNAADAIVAAAFAVAVVEPFASGIGGGGAAIVVPDEDEATAYDYREEVPGSGAIPPGGVGVPGFVAGMAQIHADHGSLEWARVLEPAITLAEEGFEVSPFLALRMSSDYGPEAISGLDHFTSSGVPLAAGEPLVQEELAATMRTLARDGAESFYHGDLAGEVAAVEGLDRDSLSNYEVLTADPVRGAIDEFEVLAAPPALPGVALIQMLQIAEAEGLARTAPGSAEYMELLGAGWAVGYETTVTELGDPRFVDVPVQELTDADANAAAARAGASTAAIGGPSEPGPAGAGNTTHLTAVDTDGLMISMTNTITSFWGSQHYVGGFFMNNQLTRFEAIGSTSANEPQAGRRSVSWSLPAVVADQQGRAVLGIGTPGADRIPQVMAQVITRWAMHDQSLEEAVAAPRFAYESNQVLVEEEPDADAAAQLSLPYEVVPAEWAYFGSVQALQVDYASGQVRGAPDHRREADVAVGEP